MITDDRSPLELMSDTAHEIEVLVMRQRMGAVASPLPVAPNIGQGARCWPSHTKAALTWVAKATERLRFHHAAGDNVTALGAVRRERDSTNGALAIVAFEPAHARTFVPGPFDWWATGTPEFIDLVNNVWPGNALSVRKMDKTLGVVWYRMEGSTAVVGWHLSDELRRHKTWLFRACCWFFPDVVRGSGATRIRVEIYRQFPEARRWVERLGYRKCGGDAAYFIYERDV